MRIVDVERIDGKRKIRQIGVGSIGRIGTIKRPRENCTGNLGNWDKLRKPRST